jgi:HTH-type transcriptional regulator / antitoxin HigA
MVRAQKDAPFNPDWASPPGESIADILEDRGIAVEDFGQKMRMSPPQVVALIAGKLRIDRVIAIRLQKVLGPPARFWLRREQHYRRRKRHLEKRALRERGVRVGPRKGR